MTASFCYSRHEEEIKITKITGHLTDVGLSLAND